MGGDITGCIGLERARYPYLIFVQHFQRVLGKQVRCQEVVQARYTRLDFMCIVFVNALLFEQNAEHSIFLSTH